MGFSLARQRAVCSLQSEVDIWFKGYIFANAIILSIPALLFFFISFNTHLLPNFLSLLDLCRSSQPRLHLPSLYTFLHLTLPSLPPRCVSVMECVLVVAFPFPSLSLPLSMGTLGLRQSCVAMAAGCVAELCTPGIWSLSP